MCSSSHPMMPLYTKLRSNRCGCGEKQVTHHLPKQTASWALKELKWQPTYGSCEVSRSAGIHTVLGSGQRITQEVLGWVSKSGHVPRREEKRRKSSRLWLCPPRTRAGWAKSQWVSTEKCHIQQSCVELRVLLYMNYLYTIIQTYTTK